MIPESRMPTHPGEVLSEEFLVLLGVTPMELARHVGVPVQQINEIVLGQRGVSCETAWLFSQAFGTSPEFWVHLQNNYDLYRTRPNKLRIKPLKPF